MVTVQEVTDLTKEKPKRKVKRKPYKKVFKLFSKPDPKLTPIQAHTSLSFLYPLLLAELK